MCICALRGGLGGTVARRVPLVGLAVGFLVAFFVFSQKGHRRAKIREHRCKQQMPLMGMAPVMENSQKEEKLDVRARPYKEGRPR